MAGGQRSGLNKPCILLIVIAGMERFAFKGVASNLVSYLTDVVKMSNSSAAKTVNSWCGFTSMLPLLVAPLADSYWDQYSTITVSALFYVLGLLALTSTAWVWPWTPINKTSTPSSSIFWSLYMISIGQAGFNPSLQAFGAEQLENEDDDDEDDDDEDEDEDELPRSKNHNQRMIISVPDKKGLFFQWWYFGVCSGSLLGVSIMSYIQDTVGWGLGFAVPTLIMVASTAFFSCGSRFYTYRQGKGGGADIKSFQSVVRGIRAAAFKLMNAGFALSNESDAVEVELEDNPVCHRDLAVGEDLNNGSKTGFHLREIAEVVLHLFPVWTMLLMFAVIFQQPSTFFTKQGMTMERTIGTTFKIPPAALQSAITVSIILLMPFYDSFFVPLARTVTGDEKGVTVMQRMGIGMVLSVVAMVVAAIVETKRLKLSRNTESETVPLSIFWLLPQYILLGISDIFTVVGMQQFFYGEVPARMRTMGIALYTSVFGVGSFMSALLISMVEYLTSSGGGRRSSWFDDDMREARLDKYYWLLAVGSALSLLTFVILCRFYKSGS